MANASAIGSRVEATMLASVPLAAAAARISQSVRRRERNRSRQPSVSSGFSAALDDVSGLCFRYRNST